MHEANAVPRIIPAGPAVSTNFLPGAETATKDIPPTRPAVKKAALKTRGPPILYKGIAGMPDSTKWASQ